MVDAKQSGSVIQKTIVHVTVLRGEALQGFLKVRAKSNVPALCFGCGCAIRPGDVVLRKEFCGHVEFLHSGCCFSRPHI